MAGSGRWWPLAVIAVVAFAIGLYARFLNHFFYASHGPFYDSVAYSLDLAALYRQVSSKGLIAGINYAATAKSTVFLPWIEACLLALVGDLRRDICVWLQLPWLFALGAAAYRYLSSKAAFTPPLAICLSLPLMAINAVFFFDGGLSDFRMDLLQYALFGITCITYLSIRANPRAERIQSWLLFGLLAGLTCLARATTPIYLFLVFTPMIVSDVFVRRGSVGAVLWHYAAAGIALAVVAGWFYVNKFRYLYYYYFVWNTDANAHLSLRESIAHVSLLLRQNIGWPLCLFLGFSLLLGIASRLRQGARETTQFNWRALWCGLAPVGFLVLSGAGLNPFVSMVSATGFLIFCIVPWEGDASRSRSTKIALMIGSVAAVTATAAAGIANHSDDRYVSWVPKSAATSAIADQLIADLDDRPPGAYTFSMVHCGSINTHVVINTLVYDRTLKYEMNSAVSNGRWMLTSFGEAAEAVTTEQWEKIPGKSDEEKITGIVQSLLDNADYLLLPEPDSKLAAYVFINNQALLIRQRLIDSGKLVALGPRISVAPGETVTWYVNRRRP